MRRLDTEHTRECNSHSHREFGAKSKRLVVVVGRQLQHVLGSHDVDQVGGENDITKLPVSQHGAVL